MQKGFPLYRLEIQNINKIYSLNIKDKFVFYISHCYFCEVINTEYSLMGIFSKSCEYAMRAVFLIAQKSANGEKTGIKEIAQSVNSPEPFLAKILQKLAKDNLIYSSKGPGGGFYLDRDGLKLPMAAIVKSIDGDSLFVGCGLGFPQCSELNPCPLHDAFKGVRQMLTDMLNNMTVGQFNEALLSGKVSLKK